MARVACYVLLGSVVWLLAAATVHPRTEEAASEAGECVDFRVYFSRWEDTRVELMNAIVALHNELVFLPTLRTFRMWMQWTSCSIGGASAAAHVYQGRPQVAVGSLWMGVVCLYTVDWGLKMWFERNIHSGVTEVRKLAALDSFQQASMVAQSCDDPPFLGIDHTVEEIEASVGILRPEPWTDHFLDMINPSREEQQERREWLLKMHTKLRIKLGNPVDVKKTVVLSADEAARRRRPQGEQY